MTTWTIDTLHTLIARPFFELIHQAYTVHQQHFKLGEIQFSKLANIKTGACPEDCAYCPQSAHYNTGLKKEKLLDKNSVLALARQAKANGATRFCMGAAWRSPPKKELPKVAEMIREVKQMGLETCVTLGLLDAEDAALLKDAGLDFYNHNLDTSEEFYKEVISTRTYEDRLRTIQHVSDHDIHVCCGGILGMGESRDDRLQLLLTLAQLPTIPKSIPINQLIPIPGTPLADQKKIDTFEFVRTVAVTRIVFPSLNMRIGVFSCDTSGS